MKISEMLVITVLLLNFVECTLQKMDKEIFKKYSQVH